MHPEIYLPVIGVAGAGVLGSYAWGLQQPQASKLWGPVLSQPDIKKAWSVFAVLTALSFLYLLVYVWFLLDDESATFFGEDFGSLGESLYATGFIVLTLVASGYMYLALRQRQLKRYSKALSANLWSVAGASGLLFLLPMATSDGDTMAFKHIAARVSGTLLLIQHLVWDAVVWNYSTNV